MTRRRADRLARHDHSVRADSDGTAVAEHDVMRGIILVTLLTACTTESDAPPPDDPNDDMPAMSYRHYVIDHIDVPTSAAQAREYGMDLDGNGSIDNQLGNVIATLSGMGVDANATVARSIDRGETILLARVGTTSLADAAVGTFQTYVGSDPSIPPCASDTDTECRHHLTGTASFTAMHLPAGTPLKGSFTGGEFTGSGGQLVIRLALLGSAPIDVVLLASQARLSSSTDSQIGKATLAGAVAQSDIDAKIIPAVRDNVMASVTRDCTALTSPPGCGCTTGSDGKTALALFDTSPQDCSISLTEVRNNTLVKSLLTPDVSIAGTMGLSIGVTASAVSAQFTAP